MWHVVPRYFYRGPRCLSLRLSDGGYKREKTRERFGRFGVAVPSGGIRKKNNTGRVPRERCHAVPRGGVKKRIARGPRELCRSVPWGVPFPSLLLAPFFARSLTLVLRCLLLNRTETLATQGTERGVSLCATAWR